MESKKTVADWEKEQGIMFLDTTDEKGKTVKVKPDQEMTALEFRELSAGGNHKAVNHAEREQWLLDNGHEVNRKNMLADDLEEASPEEKAKIADANRKQPDEDDDADEGTDPANKPASEKSDAEKAGDPTEGQGTAQGASSNGPGAGNPDAEASEDTTGDNQSNKQ